MQLLEQPALPVGVGCIRQVWQGSPQAIQARMNRDLATATEADILLDPRRFTAIEYGSSEVVVAPITQAGCDDRGATVLKASARGGAVSAQVSNSGPVDVVFRVSAFPTWKVWVDGAAAPTPTLVAPGFFSVRVPPGTHHVSAEVSLLPHYGTLIVLAALATIALAVLRGRGRLVLGWLERTWPQAL